MPLLREKPKRTNKHPMPCLSFASMKVAYPCVFIGLQSVLSPTSTTSTIHSNSLQMSSSSKSQYASSVHRHSVNGALSGTSSTTQTRMRRLRTVESSEEEKVNGLARQALSGATSNKTNTTANEEMIEEGIDTRQRLIQGDESKIITAASL